MEVSKAKKTVKKTYDLFELYLFIIIEFLAKAVYLSVDPYMRAYAYKMPLGSTMVGTQVAE